MTRKTKSDLEVIEAYKQQARSRRLSSKLRSGEQVMPLAEGFTARIDSRCVSLTTEGVTQSRDGKVTVIMKGSKPLTPTQASHLFGTSRVSIPEYRSFKDSILEKSKPPQGSTSGKKR